MKENGGLYNRGTKKRVAVFILLPIALVLISGIVAILMALFGVTDRYINYWGIIFFSIFGLLGVVLIIYTTPIVKWGIFHSRRTTTWAVRVEGVLIIVLSAWVVQNAISYI